MYCIAVLGRQIGGRKTVVKNKSAADRQITAEQMLRESMERGGADQTFRPPKRVITDHQELAELRLQKRKEYEDTIRRSRTNMGVWAQYALWEASQKEFERARSVFERAIDVDYKNQSIWLKYAEMEMKNRFVNHARNVWDRAVTLLPRVDQFWYKFSYMEEMLGNVAGARQIFERWMKWAPGPNAWNTYIKFEVRRRNIPRARSVYERMLITHNELETYLKFAKFEVKHGKKEYGRLVYERALKELGEDAHREELFVAFAKFEEACKEFDRARVIYKYALDNVPKEEAKRLYEMYSAFEKKHGTRETVEDVILSKRRFQYEEEIRDNPLNYDAWFDYIRLEEAKGKKDRIREVYERAISNKPPVQEKRFWKRYVFLWINYAVFEELDAKDVERARMVWRACLQNIPHKVFTFAKVWLMAARFEVRQRDLKAARQLLGTALGKCPKEKLFKGYIELEFRLAEIDRCRKIYEKYLEFMPENCQAWKKYGELEGTLQESERARAIFEMAVNQEVLDMPEMLWKAYIDFEIRLKQFDRVRELYRRLLKRTKHVRVWISFAQFETSINDIKRARGVFEEANDYFKSGSEDDSAASLKEERVMLVETWLEFETNRGSNKTVQKVKDMLPRRVRNKRLIKAEDGSDAYWEEYYDYIFPDEDQKQQTNFKLLEMARKWKTQQKMEED
eukprot:jgi/Bigna1/56574/estExt_Genewise1Plus.C_1060008